MHETPALETSIATFFDGEERNRAVNHLRSYCSGRRQKGDLSLWRYSGAWFDQLADQDHPNEITPRDLTAITMLSVSVPPHSAIWLLDEGKAEITSLLNKISSDLPITKATDRDLGDGSAPAALLSTLRTLDGVGPVTASKLLAAKRPALIPIYDEQVVAALKPPKNNYWLAMRNSLRDCEAQVQSVADEGGVELPLLRVVDIVVWMRQHGYKYLPA